MKCTECKQDCEKPITKVDMSFDLGGSRYGAADWDEKKQFCCVSCMMTNLRKQVDKALRGK